MPQEKRERQSLDSLRFANDVSPKLKLNDDGEIDFTTQDQRLEDLLDLSDKIREDLSEAEQALVDQFFLHDEVRSVRNHALWYRLLLLFFVVKSIVPLFVIQFFSERPDNFINTLPAVIIAAILFLWAYIEEDGFWYAVTRPDFGTDSRKTQAAFESAADQLRLRDASDYSFSNLRQTLNAQRRELKPLYHNSKKRNELEEDSL